MVVVVGAIDSSLSAEQLVSCIVGQAVCCGSILCEAVVIVLWLHVAGGGRTRSKQPTLTNKRVDGGSLVGLLYKRPSLLLLVSGLFLKGNWIESE